MKLYERIENNNFDEIDRNRAIELIEGGNGHLVYNENYFKLQKENEELKNQEATQRKINELLVQRYSNSISVQKVKDKIEEVQKEYNKLDKQVDEYINDANKDLSKYYENKEKIGTMQTLAWIIENLQELLEGRK